jgi:hypothetical protein
MENMLVAWIKIGLQHLMVEKPASFLRTERFDHAEP